MLFLGDRGHHQPQARFRQLHEKNAATKDDVDERELLFRTATEEYKAAKFAEEIARYELELAKAALIRTRSDSTDGQFDIRSPITGRVLRVQQESATVVTPGTALVELAVPRFLREEHDRAFDVVPLYLRKSDAEIAWDRRARSI